MNKDEKNITAKSTNGEFIQKPKVEDFDLSKSLEEHMEENRTEIKTQINFKQTFIYLLMVVISVVCVLLLVHFCEDSIARLNKKTSTTAPKYQLVKPTTKPIQTVEYVRTTSVPTAATHTIFVGNTTRITSTKVPERTNNVQIKTTKKSSTTTKIESATEATTDKIVGEN